MNIAPHARKTRMCHSLSRFLYISTRCFDLEEIRSTRLPRQRPVSLLCGCSTCTTGPSTAFSTQVTVSAICVSTSWAAAHRQRAGAGAMDATSAVGWPTAPQRSHSSKLHISTTRNGSAAARKCDLMYVPYLKRSPLTICRQLNFC